MHNEVQLIPLIETIQYIPMTDEEYFSNKYSNYISNSRLSLINPNQEGSPEIYLNGLSENNKNSSSLTLGSAVHELILQPDLFNLVDQITSKPSSKLGLMADELYPLYKQFKVIDDKNIIEASNKIDYYKGTMNDKKIQNVHEKCSNYWSERFNFELKNNIDKTNIFLDSKSIDKVKLCLSSVNNNKEIMSLLHPTGIFDSPTSINEAALFIDIVAKHNDKEVVLKLKSKLDNFTVDEESDSVVLNDLKTTGHWLTDFPDSFIKWHYSRQMAFYGWILRLYIQSKGMNIKSFTTNMLVVSTVPNYYSGVFPVSNSKCKEGFIELKDLLQRVAYCELYGFNGTL